MWATFAIKKLPKVNNHPMGENLANLVTLLTTFLAGLAMHLILMLKIFLSF
jgi:hypothetical protein